MRIGYTPLVDMPCSSIDLRITYVKPPEVARFVDV
jgi:hypothetical protein